MLGLCLLAVQVYALTRFVALCLLLGQVIPKQKLGLCLLLSNLLGALFVTVQVYALKRCLDFVCYCPSNSQTEAWPLFVTVQVSSLEMIDFVCYSPSICPCVALCLLLSKSMPTNRSLAFVCYCPIYSLKRIDFVCYSNKQSA